MKNTIIFLSLIASASFGQDTVRYLEGNNVSATIANKGVFFRGEDVSQPGYEFPKEANNFLIHSNAFWFGATDGAGSVKIAAETFGGVDEDDVPMRDFFPGAIAVGTAEAPAEPYAGDVYVVSKEEILYHAVNYNVWDYEMPYAIEHWPAHGDVALGLAPNLAPFADLNGNGIYEPELGEYPEIRGDHAAYVILNDKGGIHTSSGGDPLGIEIHYMFYQFETEDYLNNTTFINMRVINRSSNTYPDFVVGNFMDADIGFYDDDMTGCDFDKDYMYFFNGDLNDEPHSGRPGYGDMPPALGVVSLNNEMAVCVTAASGAPVWPESPVDYWNLLSGVYPYIEDDFPGDKRLFMASDSMEFAPGEVKCFDYALILSADGGAFENRDALSAMTDDVTEFFDGMPGVYCDFTVGQEELKQENIQVEIYPNPSNGQFTIYSPQNYTLSIYSMDGRLAHVQNEVAGTSTFDLSLVPGTYLVTLDSPESRITKKLVIEK